MAGVENRIALVTGAGRGIGEAVAKTLAERGARVMAVARSEAELKALGMDYVVADLGTAAGCSRAVEETERRLGKVQVFVCNHGIGSAHEKVVWEQDPATWEETLRINLDGVFNVTRQLLPGMLERGWGRIVNISSVNGQKGQIGQTNYAAAKAGMHGFTKSLALEVARKGITVNTVSPGYIATEMVMAVREDIRQQIVAQIPVGRLGEPEEIAAAVERTLLEEARRRFREELDYELEASHQQAFAALHADDPEEADRLRERIEALLPGVARISGGGATGSGPFVSRAPQASQCRL